MFERFTEPARQVVVLAQEEALTLRHGQIGSDHIVLGLLREEEGVAARTLGRVGLDVEPARAKVALIAGAGEADTPRPIPFSAGAKDVFALALREALSLGDNQIGTEHLLLGLLRERGAGSRVLLESCVDPEEVRNEVERILSRPGRPRVSALTDPTTTASGGSTSDVEIGEMSDSEIDNRITALLNEQRAIAYVTRIVEDKLSLLRAERENRRGRPVEPESS